MSNLSDDDYSEPADEYNPYSRSKKVTKKIRKNTRRAAASHFLEDEADEGSDEEDNYYDPEQEIAEEETHEFIKQYDARRQQQRRAQIHGVDDIDQHAKEAENYANYLDSREVVPVDNHELTGDLKKTLLPNISDPALWLIKCTPGKEQYCAASLMNKSVALRCKGTPIHIFSVTVSERIEGMIYLEAFKEGHVREAIKGMIHIRQQKVTQIPREEMHQVYEMDKANKIQLKKNQWVRIKNGLYTGDLAKVIGVTEAKNGAFLKLIPRIPSEEELERRKKEKGYAMRPQKKLFNPSYVNTGDVRELIHEFIGKRVFKWNKMCFRKGFLIKFFTQRNLDIANINPTYNEINSFNVPKKQSANDSEDSSSESEGNDAEMEKTNDEEEETDPEKIFSKGDIIKIINGELKNLTGKVETIDENLIKFRPHIDQYDNMLEIDHKSVIKYFRAGDAVRVIGGHFKGEKGIVTKISGAHVYIFSNILMKEFVVSANNLKLASEISEVVDKDRNISKDNEFRIHTVCRSITGNRIFCVIDVEKESVKVLDEFGAIKFLQMKELQIIRGKRKPGLDMKNNKIFRNDAVRIVDGMNKGLKGRVIYVEGNILFLHNKEYVQTLGVFVDRCRNALILGSTLIPEKGDSRYRAGRFPSNNQRRQETIAGKYVTI
jgi:transcription elongation factor SPT5